MQIKYGNFTSGITDCVRQINNHFSKLLLGKQNQHISESYLSFKNNKQK